MDTDALVEEIIRIFQEFDEDNSGYIDENEFVSGMRKYFKL